MRTAASAKWSFPMDLQLARAFAAANDLPALDGGSERKTGGIKEELQEILFGTNRRL